MIQRKESSSSADASSAGSSIFEGQSWHDGPKLGEELGSYRLLDVLGEGGMGRVYLAEHTLIGRRVAIKVLSLDRSFSPSALRSFCQEALAANQIHHDNIVQITDFVDSHPRYKFHVMELLRGETLRALYDREPKQSMERVIDIAVQIAGGLGAAHENGVVHRDLKPENIFLTRRSDGADFVKLLDFGAAKLLGDVGKAGPHPSEPIIGTPLYMAPEQMWGEPTDYRTDVYSFGLLLYEMITGRLPFAAKRFSELREERSSTQPCSPSTYTDLAEPVPPQLEALVMECLAYEPDARPQDMAVVARRLRLLRTAQQGRAALRARPSGRARLGSRVSYAAAVLLLAITAASAWLFGAGTSQPQVSAPSVVFASSATPTWIVPNDIPIYEP